MITILVVVILLIVLRIQVLSPVFFAFFAVLPIMAFAGNKRKYTNEGEDTENEIFHDDKFHTPSTEESKA